MPNVAIDITELSGVTPGTDNLKDAVVWFYPYQPYGSPLVTTDKIVVDTVDGVATTFLPETPAGNGLYVEIRRVRLPKAYSKFIVAIPASDCNLFDLPHLDPTTLDPAAPLDPAWLVALDDEEAARADADADLQAQIDAVGPGAVASVNTKTGVVVINPDDLDDTSTTHKFVTAAEKTKLGNTSGTNTGDQDLSGLVPNTRTVAGHALSSNVTLVKGDVGLGSVDNTADANKPVSTAQATADATTAARTTTELWQRFRSVANGAVPNPPTGQTLVCFGSVTTPVIIGGKISSATSTGPSASYTQAQLTDNVSRIGARWTIASGSTTPGTIGIIAWADDYSQHQLPSPIVPDSICHLAISSTGWTYSTVDTSGTFHTAASGTFDTALVADGTTVHTAEVVIDRENGVAYVQLPDGTTATVTDTRIKTLNSTWAVVEEYRGNSTTSLVGILEWWADSQHSGEVIASARDRALNTGAWTNIVTFNNGWGNFGSVFPPLSWRREGNVIRVRGAVSGGTATLGALICTFPIPPAYVVAAPTVASGGGFGSAWILGKASGGTAGQFQYLTGGNTALFFDFTYPIG